MRTLSIALFLTLPLTAQETEKVEAAKAAKVVEVVVVQAGAAARPAPTKIVRVAPAPRRSPEGTYEGTRPPADWRWFGRGGPARSRASYAIWRTRFAPVHPFRYVPHVYHAGARYRRW